MYYFFVQVPAHIIVAYQNITTLHTNYCALYNV